nr:hypothetical protein [uncultured Desulfobacter sp.]
MEHTLSNRQDTLINKTKELSGWILQAHENGDTKSLKAYLKDLNDTHTVLRDEPVGQAVAEAQGQDKGLGGYSIPGSLGLGNDADAENDSGPGISKGPGFRVKKSQLSLIFTSVKQRL